MNARLRNLPDGSGSGLDVVWFQKLKVSLDQGRWRESDHGEIYWPFAIAMDLDEKYGITHLPSGYAVGTRPLTRLGAIAVIDRLRGLPVDWQFTQPKGKQWEACKAAAKAIVQRYK